MFLELDGKDRSHGSGTCIRTIQSQKNRRKARRDDTKKETERTDQLRKVRVTIEKAEEGARKRRDKQTRLDKSRTRFLFSFKAKGRGKKKREADFHEAEFEAANRHSLSTSAIVQLSQQIALSYHNRHNSKQQTVLFSFLQRGTHFWTQKIQSLMAKQVDILQSVVSI